MLSALLLPPTTQPQNHEPAIRLGSSGHFIPPHLPVTHTTNGEGPPDIHGPHLKYPHFMTGKPLPKHLKSLSLQSGFMMRGKSPASPSFFLVNFFFFFFFLAALGLRCCARAFSGCGKWRLLFIEMRGLLMAVASRCGARALGMQALLLWHVGSVVVAHGL